MTENPETPARPLMTSNGVPITNELIESVAAEFEAGIAPSRLVPRSPGRPLIGAAPAKALAVRFPPELRDRLQKQAEQDGVSEADVVRRAVDVYVKTTTRRAPRTTGVVRATGTRRPSNPLGMAASIIHASGSGTWKAKRSDGSKATVKPKKT